MLAVAGVWTYQRLHTSAIGVASPVTKRGGNYYVDRPGQPSFPNGNYYFTADLGDAGTRQFKLAMSHAQAVVFSKRANAGQAAGWDLGINGEWRQPLSFTSVPTQKQLDGHRCVVFEGSEPLSNSAAQLAAQAALRIDAIEGSPAELATIRQKPAYRLLQEKTHRLSISICAAGGESDLPSSGTKPEIGLLALAEDPQAAAGLKTGGTFHVTTNSVYGYIIDTGPLMTSMWAGAVNMVEAGTATDALATRKSPPNATHAVLPEQKIEVPGDQVQGRLLPTEGQIPRDALRLHGAYYCFEVDDGRPDCNFTPDQPSLKALGESAGFLADDFGQMQFSNRDGVLKWLAPHGDWTSGSCWKGGTATIWVVDIQHGAADGGELVAASLQYAEPDSDPRILPTEEQPEGCDPSISGLD